MTTPTANIVYFSNVSNNTHRFVQKLELEAIRIPILTKEAAQFTVDNPYVLITPTYGDVGFKNLVPRQVVKFLNNNKNAELLQGVIAAGNINFGREYGRAGDIISQRFKVPMMYKFEIMGLPTDVETVKRGLDEFWLHHSTQTISH